MTDRLSPRQWELLDRVCRTNGGGVSCYGEHESTYRSLERRGLIQGKSGQQYRAVHTREGLTFWSARTAIAAGTQRAETGETPAPSEGCQSGPKASPSPSHRSTGE